MSKLILPDDPEFHQPTVWGDAIAKGLTPKSASDKIVKQASQEAANQVRYAQTMLTPTQEWWYKQAQMASPGINNMVTSPMWFSPIHTPMNWQIASKRREIYNWCRFFYTNEAKVAAAIDFYCFDPTMQVLLADGRQKAISSVQPGDLVRSHDGSSNVVKNKFVRRTRETMLSVAVSGICGGKTMRVTTGHEILTERDGEITFVKAGELRKGDYLLTPILYDSIPDCETINKDLAWLLGVYAAEGCGIPYEKELSDGSVHKRFKGVYFTISIDERDFADRIRSAVHRVYGENKVTITEIPEKGKIRISAYGLQIADDLIGLCPGMSRTGTKRFAPVVMGFGKKTLLSILCGFLDGDGCFNAANGFQGVGVSKTLCEQIANICDILGLEYSFTSTRISKGNRQTCYNIRISRRSCDLLSDACYKIYEHQIDESKIRNTPYFAKGKYIYRKIRFIKEYEYEGNVYDLEIENSHSYVVNRVAVHNSGFPLNGFDLACKDNNVLKFFEHKIVRKLDLLNILRQVASEYYMLGDVFVHTDIECPHCGGTARDPKTGRMCNHPDGMISKLRILNPDWIEVHQPVISDEPYIVLIPDEELTTIVMRRRPRQIYDSLPDYIKQYVAAHQPIPLSNRVTSHLKHMPVPYGTYGTSLIRRLFQTLAYKTKIMTANWIVAERLIVPVRIVKIGSDQRPASSADISDVQMQLAATANDPNLTIVTHHNFELEWYGACFPQTNDIQVLTPEGWKTYEEINDDDLVGTFNKESGILEFQQFTQRHEYEYDSSLYGPLYSFGDKLMDIPVTPNHRMLVRKGRWTDRYDTVMSQDVKRHHKIPCRVGWNGKLPPSLPYRSCSALSNMSLHDFLRFAGYYVSEGHVQKWFKSRVSTEKVPQSIGISQNVDQPAYEKIKSLMYGISDRAYIHKDERREVATHTVKISDVRLADYMVQEFGAGSSEKLVPRWILDLPKAELRIFLNAAMEGDGQTREMKTGRRFRYSTVSKHLADDIFEIVLKLGYTPYVTVESVKSLHRSDIYRVSWSNLNRTKERQVQDISRRDYKGKVWCLTVPNEYLVVRFSGRCFIVGNSGKILQVTSEMEYVGKEILDGFMLNQALLNGEMASYSSAQVGVETLIRRIESFRYILAEWVQENIFRPVAEMQGFVDEAESEKIGEKVYLYPKLKWFDLNIRDKTQYHQILLQLHDKQIISTQTLCEELDIDYDQEVARLRYEQIQGGGAAMMAGGAPGAGGMGPMPGGGGPAGGPLGPAAGPGGEMAPGGDMGGAGGMPGGDLGGPMAPAAGVQKVTKKGKGGQQEDVAPATPPTVRLTSLEQKMAQMLFRSVDAQGIHRDQVRAQFPVENPHGGKPYSLDFALPKLKLAIEVDGEVWHNSPKKIASDKERDYLLAQRGWTVLRYDDSTIEEAPKAVEQSVFEYIKNMADKYRSGLKTASIDEGAGINLYQLKKGKLSNLDDDWGRYVRPTHKTKIGDLSR